MQDADTQRHMEIEVRFASDRSPTTTTTITCFPPPAGTATTSTTSRPGGNNPDFESDWQEAECGLSGDDDDF